MQLVGHVPYNLALSISLFLKRDHGYKALAKVIIAKKLIEELDIDLRSRVST